MALNDSSFIALDPELYKENTELNLIKNYVLRQLGWPLIRVEVTDEMLFDNIIDAIQRYSDYAASDYNVEFVHASGNIVNVPAHIKKSSIVNIIFQQDFFDSLASGVNMMDADILGGVPAVNMWSSVLNNDFDIATYFLYMQRIEDVKKLFGIAKTYDIINDQIHLYPASGHFGQIGILYKPITSDSMISQIPWIRDWAKQKTKYTWGEIRSKLSGFSSTGANIFNNGDTLKSEAQTELDKLEEKLLLLGPPMPILQG